VVHSWRLNERHYGALQGLNKQETAMRFGEAQVQAWRRSYSVAPPALSPEDDRWCGRDPRYHMIKPEQIPLTDPMAQIAGTSSYIYFETDIFPGLAITEENPGVYATAYGMLADFVRTGEEAASAL